jgi:type I restriction-modification system DNA methylase subunit
MKLLKENVLFIILPSGYIGNKNKTYTELRKFILQYKVLGIFELKNTFKRSGTGVNTALLIIQKTECKCPYEIYSYQV